MIRVSHIVTGLNTGGAEVMLYRLLSRIDRARFDPTVISLIDTGPMGERIEAMGTPVYSLGMRAGRFSPPALARFRRILREVRPGLLQGWMYHGNLAASLARWLSMGRPPVIWGIHHSLHDFAAERAGLRAVIRLCRLVSRSAEAVVYVSSASAAQHESFGFRHRRLEMIPNGFDVAAFKPDPDLREMFRAGIGVGARETLIGLFARYHPMKDHRNFFQAAARLVAEGRDLRMVLAGSGVDSENRELCTIIREMGLSERTLLLGERGDVAEILPGLDILCMSSSHGEAFPLVLGEAMAAGVPCVATDLGDAARLVGDAGRIVPPREPEALATALGELIDLGVDERRTMGAIGRQRIIDNFSLDTAAGKYHLLYQELLAEWPPSQN